MPAWNGRPEVRTPASNHRLPQRTLNNNLNIMPSHYRTVRLQQGLWEKNTTRRVEIFFPNRRSEPLQLSHPHACNFAICLSYLLFRNQGIKRDRKIEVLLDQEAIVTISSINPMNATIRILTHKGLSVSDF